MSLHWPLAALLSCCALAAPACATEPIVFAVTAENHLPIAEIHGETLRSGLLKDIGDALAARLGRRPEYRVLPSKRLDAALTAGEVDVACNQTPEWRSAALIWTVPLFQDRGWLVVRSNQPPVRRMEELAGKRVGMVQGYVYVDPSPEVQARLERDDAPSMRANIEKFLRGYNDYALVNELSFRYFLKQSGSTVAIHPPLMQPVFEPACGISPRSRISAAKIQRAAADLVAEQAMSRLLERYR
ncbi:substrate-binding periplasmic protein [Niveibacterium sp.]|uniref:substrate-binding periplasmic protein n=1 Tax=Niveibacterium sp. TaxID=2017444 RepID=UPI0035B06918